VAAHVDTNVLVYRFDLRFPQKQRTATEVLRKGIENDSIRLAHQGVLEFFAAVTRSLPGHGPLLNLAEARRETEDLLSQFIVLYPNDELIRLAIRGHATYQLSWFDAHMWAYAEYYGLEEILSEDFEHGRLYGTVRVINPFSA
jgi:predicted nucleic acid-binding protein